MYAHSFGLTRPLWSGSINNIFPTDVLTFANLFLACVKMAQTNNFIYSSVLNQYHFLFKNITSIYLMMFLSVAANKWAFFEVTKQDNS